MQRGDTAAQLPPELTQLHATEICCSYCCQRKVVSTDTAKEEAPAGHPQASFQIISKLVKIFGLRVELIVFVLL